MKKFKEFFKSENVQWFKAASLMGLLAGLAAVMIAPLLESPEIAVKMLQAPAWLVYGFVATISLICGIGAVLIREVFRFLYRKFHGGNNPPVYYDYF